MKITILDDTLRFVRGLPFMSRLADHQVEVWNDHTKDVGILAERLRDTEALILLRERTPIRAPLIERLQHLRMITLNGPHPHVDVEACTARGVLLCAGPPRPSSATAELTWGLIIAAMRRIPQEMERLKKGHWQGSLGTGLKGRTLGVCGYGTIGRQVAGFGRAFGMKVIVSSREAGLASARADGFEGGTREGLFEQADVVSLHVRLKPETRGIIGADLLARMKPTALLVNTSRAELIQPGALLAALRTGRPGMAACDVYETEPHTNTADELINLPNVVCTPHLGYFERDQLERYYNDQCERVLAYAGGQPMNVVNPAAQSRQRPA